MKRISLGHIYIGKEFGVYYASVFLKQNAVIRELLEYKDIEKLEDVLQKVGFSSEIQEDYSKEEISKIVNALNNRARDVYDSYFFEDMIAYARDFWLPFETNSALLTYFKDKIRFCMYEVGECYLCQKSGVLEELQEVFPDSTMKTSESCMRITPSYILHDGTKICFSKTDPMILKKM